MAKIFLWYRREDSAGVAGRIYDRLRGYFGPDAVFFNVDSVPLGVDFQEYYRVVVKPLRRLPRRDRTRLGEANQHWSGQPGRLGSD